MLNVCSVLQLLSVRIKMDRVYELYTFQPDTWYNVRDETRLYFTAQEAQEWQDALSEYTALCMCELIPKAYALWAVHNIIDAIRSSKVYGYEWSIN